jgi:tRNA(fMet)-specific endonuclease VapC
MKRFILDTGIAALHLDPKRGVFELKSIGRPIGENDIMIAAIALSLGNATVVTMDSDLAAVPGLTIEN